ncbi:MAG: AMP-binding protein [Rhodospirillales bacterium]
MTTKTPDGIVWPGLATVDDAGLRALQSQLADTQWMSASELIARQMVQLRRLAAHATATTAFHADRLAPLLTASDAPPTMSDLRKVPIMTRQDLQIHGRSIRSSALPASHAPVDELRSSGSTGEPVGVLTTAVTALFYVAFNLRLHAWHDKDFAADVAAIKVLRGDETEHSARDRPLPWVPGDAGGRMYVFEISRPVSEQLAWLQAHDPAYLLTYPSNLRELLQRSREIGYRPPNLRAVNTMSETVESGLRRACREIWNVPVIDAYSAIECGMIALQCPDNDHYHVQAENVIVEIIDDTGQPCVPGQHGRVLVTDLHNFAMPLIRYAIGDFATVGKPCSCGRGLPVIGRVLGRSRNMVRYPDGDSAWPTAWLSTSMNRIADIRGIQMVQHSTEEIEVRLIVPRKLPAATEGKLGEYFIERLGHPFRFRFSYVDALERSAGGKFEDFICRIP